MRKLFAVSTNYLEKMNELYLATERQFLEFNEIVPFATNNWNVNSPRLYFILLTTCGQIESVMERTCKILRMFNTNDDFPALHKKLNSNGVLELQKVALIKTQMEISPFFKNYKDHFWWISHNKAKHDLPSGLKQGTIKNVIYALASLYSLHNILSHVPTEKKKVILESKYWQTHKPVQVSITNQPRYYDERKSKLFISYSNFHNWWMRGL